MKQHFIAIQATYLHVEIALFKKRMCIEGFSQSGQRASSHLILYLVKLLKQHNLSLSDLAFIAVDKGPGAFTSLRVAIATVNGIGFTNKISLIGIESHQALASQVRRVVSSSPDAIITLLNAYNNDVYYSISLLDDQNIGWIVCPMKKGCSKVDQIVAELATTCSGKSVIFTGNAYPMHQAVIEQELGHTLRILHIPIATPSAETIGLIAYDYYQQGRNLVQKIEPEYGKTQCFAIK